MTTERKIPKHGGRCVHCRHLITAMTTAEWRGKVRKPCPNCGKLW